MGFAPPLAKKYEQGYSTWAYAALQDQYIPFTGGWREDDLSKFVPEGATGVIFRFINTDAGVGRGAGCRKKGVTTANTGDVLTDSHTWAICGVDKDRKIETYKESGVLEIMIAGYVGENFEFLDTLIDVTPAESSWETVNVSAYGSGIAAIFEIENISSAINTYGFRKYGSAQDVKGGGGHAWFMCPLDTSMRCQLYIWKGVPAQKIYLIGFVKGGMTFYTDKQLLATTGDGTYRDLVLSGFKANPILAILSLYSPFGAEDWAARKNFFAPDVYRRGTNNNNAFLHPNTPDSIFQYKLANAAQELYLVGIT